MELIVLVYKLTALLPDSEKFGLSSQMRRAVISVLSNFVEGYPKKSNKEKELFLERATTSLHELDAQADACLHLNFWKPTDYTLFETKGREVGYLLHRYRLKVNQH